MTAEGLGKSVDIIILKGNHYTPENTVRFEHESAVTLFKASLEVLARPKSTSLTFTQVERMMPHGALLAEKGTGVVNVLVVHKSLPGTLGALLTLPVQRDNAGPTSILNRQFTVASLQSSYSQNLRLERYEIFLQYDGQQERFTARLGDTPRELLRAKRRGATPQEIETLAKVLTGEFFGFPDLPVFMMTLNGAVSSGTWCEVCGKDGA